MARRSTRGRVKSKAGDERVFGAEVDGRYREPRGGEWRRTLFFIVMLVMLMVFAVGYVIPHRGWPTAVLLMIAAVWTVLAYNSRTYAYRCSSCGAVFQVPVLVNFLTLPGMARRPDGTYYSYKALKCPHCHRRTKAVVVKRVDVERERTRRRGGSKEPRLLK